MGSLFYNRYVNHFSFDNLIDNYVKPWWNNYSGYKQTKNTYESVNTQIGYEQYLRRGYERALADWHRNVPNRQIRYPEFSYSGKIRGIDTAIARLGLDYDTAYSNYSGNLLNRSLGLYSVPGRVYRSM